MAKFSHNNSVRYQNKKRRNGIALVLVIVIMTGVLSISFSVFEVVFGNLLLTGEVTNSYYALYATDRIIEKLLYLDRNNLVYAPNKTIPPISVSLDEPSGRQAQIEYRVIKGGGTIIEVHGRYPASGTKGPVKRAFRVSY